MTIEEQNLLLIDLSARLPYGVKLYHIPTNDTTTLEIIGCGCIDGDIHDLIYNFKPYLFPMSSMTEGQMKEWESTMFNDEYEILIPLPKSFDWLNAHHFDYRGLIENGLALDATNLNIY